MPKIKTLKLHGKGEYELRGGARGVMVIVVGNGLIAFHIALIPLGTV